MFGTRGSRFDIRAFRGSDGNRLVTRSAAMVVARAISRQRSACRSSHWEPRIPKGAEYVAKQFESAGLRPAGTRGYFQEIDFDVMQLNEKRSGVTLLDEHNRAEALQLGTDVTMVVRSDPSPSTDIRPFLQVMGLPSPN